MAFITADRVKETTTTTGTGAITLAGASAGFRSFSSVMSASDTCTYAIVSQTGNDWEVGLGTLTSSTTLARTTIYSSSNSNSAVSLSGAYNVFLTLSGTKLSTLLAGSSTSNFWRGDGTWAAPSSSGGIAWQAVQTTSFTASVSSAYPVNTTSGAVTVTLPASPTAGQVVQVTDYAGTFNTNNCVISRNGTNINGVASNITLAAARESVAFLYVDATQGWITTAVSVTNLSATPYTASYLIVAGGGGGGGHAVSDKGGGGGGAGGLLSGTATLTPGTTYSVTVGSGGAGGVGSSGSQTLTQGTNGSNSSFGAVGTAAVGGGGGGSGYGGGPWTGNSGGSGGGSVATASGASNGGTGTSGQGYAGGVANPPNNSSGGGGSGGLGGNDSSSTGGNGGIGTSSSITGSATYYASGGGGGAYSGTSGTASAGGGGNAAAQNSASNGTSGTAYTGGGGGGAGGASSTATSGGAGGSGVVIISVPTGNYSGNYTGTASVATNSGNTIITFTTSGSYTA